MSGNAHPPIHEELAAAVLFAQSCARGMSAHLEECIAPLLAGGDRAAARALAAMLTRGPCCTPACDAALRSLVSLIDATIARGSYDVLVQKGDLLIAGRDMPQYATRLKPDAQALKNAAEPLRRLASAVAQTIDMAEAIRTTRRLLAE